MKRIAMSIVIVLCVFGLNAQKKITISTGDELLKLLPEKLKNKEAKKVKDKVKPAKGFIGVTVHRSYGDYDQNIDIELINESPSLITVNEFLTKRLIANPVQYLIAVIDGYQGLLQSLTRENGTVDYELLIPISTTLLKIRTKGYSRDELIDFANNLPVKKIGSILEK